MTTAGPGPMATLPPVPPDSDIFPVRVTAVIAAGPPASYTFVERWLDGTAAVVDKGAGRSNTATDPAYAIDGSTFAANDLALCRRGPGAGGFKWELVRPGGATDPTGEGGCGDIATIDTDDCLSVSVVGTPDGRCSAVSNTQVVGTSYDPEASTGRRVWSGDSFETDTANWHVEYLPFDSATGSLEQLRFTDLAGGGGSGSGATVGAVVYGEPLGCYGGGRLFAVGGTVFCGGVAGAECARGKVLVLVSCGGPGCTVTITCEGSTITLPRQLCVTFSGGTGGLAALNGKQVRITYGPSVPGNNVPGWTGTFASDCGGQGFIPVNLVPNYLGCDWGLLFADPSPPPVSCAIGAVIPFPTGLPISGTTAPQTGSPVCPCPPSGSGAGDTISFSITAAGDCADPTSPSDNPCAGGLDSHPDLSATVSGGTIPAGTYTLTWAGGWLWYVAVAGGFFSVDFEFLGGHWVPLWHFTDSSGVESARAFSASACSPFSGPIDDSGAGIFGTGTVGLA